MHPSSVANPPIAPDPVLRPDAASEYCGLSCSTLAKRRLRGDPPEYLKLGRAVGYRRSALDAWLAQSQRRSTSEPTDD